ncbi:MAG: class I SAM-dependent methyltransferase [Pseudoxanthomonas sp.]
MKPRPIARSRTRHHGEPMKIGPAVRKLLPASAERKASRLYRSVFVDLGKVAALLSRMLPKDAFVLDIGGGDGDLLNLVLEARPDVRVAMVDIAGSVGKFLEPRYSERVELHPGVAIEDHILTFAGRYDAAVVSDVMHHIPGPHRASFLLNVANALRPGARMLIKDVQPGHPVATLGLFCDRYLSGDKNVALISAEQLCEMTHASLPRHTSSELGLLAVDRPNYLVQLQFE